MCIKPSTSAGQNRVYIQMRWCYFSLKEIAQRMSCGLYIDGLVQERRNSSALAMELRLSCTNQSICLATFISGERDFKINCVSRKRTMKLVCLVIGKVYRIIAERIKSYRIALRSLEIKIKMRLCELKKIHVNITVTSQWAQITAVLIVCLTDCSGAHQRKHQSSACLWLLWGESTGHRWIGSFPSHRDSNAEKLPFDDVINAL